MPLSDAAMVIGANAIKAAYGYAQLHSADAGGSYTSNVCSSARQAISWASTTGHGSWDLASQIAFTDGGANNPIFSVTIWTASSGGTCGGQFPLGAGSDLAFNAAGQYWLTSLAETGSAT